MATMHVTYKNGTTETYTTGIKHMLKAEETLARRGHKISTHPFKASLIAAYTAARENGVDAESFSKWVDSVERLQSEDEEDEEEDPFLE